MLETCGGWEGQYGQNFARRYTEEMIASSGTYDRTRNSLRNSIVATCMQLAAVLIGFWSRRIFINYLGLEVLGLNTMATSLLQFLNLTELGIGSAIAVTLYKPVHDGDRDRVREIVALQGWLYRIIALIVMMGSAVMMCFFPRIFTKVDLPMWYAYASFGVLLYSSLLSYFFNYKQILLDACQLNYKVQYAAKLVSNIKLIAQAVAVKFLTDGYLWWLVLEVVFATVTTVILAGTINRTFPFIRERVEKPSLLRHKYPTVVTKVKQLFVHKIGTFAIGYAIPLIIYALYEEGPASLIAKYGNYQLFTTNLNTFLTACFLGLAASVGNMVAENDSRLTMKVFRELFCVRFVITAVFCFCLWFLIDPFITLWLGREFLLSRTTLLLIILVFCMQNTRNVVDVYLNAYGMFQDVWAPVAEAAICLGLAFLLGSHYGLDGILAGQLISQIVIAKIWKPVFLFRFGLRQPLGIYLGLYGKFAAVAAVTLVTLLGIDSLVTMNPAESFGTFSVYALIVFVSSLLLMTGLMYLAEDGMRGFFRRMLAVIGWKK